MEYASASWLREMRCLIPWSMGTLLIYINYHIMTHVYRLDWQTRPVDFAANNMFSLSAWTYASQVLPQIARQTSTLNDERIWKLTWRQGCPFQWVDGPTVLAKQWNAGKVMYVIWDISCNLFWSDTSLVLRLQRVYVQHEGQNSPWFPSCCWTMLDRWRCVSDLFVSRSDA
jgi:hypothetical protein